MALSRMKNLLSQAPPKTSRTSFLDLVAGLLSGLLAFQHRILLCIGFILPLNLFLLVGGRLGLGLHYDD